MELVTEQPKSAILAAVWCFGGAFILLVLFALLLERSKIRISVEVFIPVVFVSFFAFLHILVSTTTAPAGKQNDEIIKILERDLNIEITNFDDVELENLGRTKSHYGELHFIKDNAEYMVEAKLERKSSNEFDFLIASNPDINADYFIESSSKISELVPGIKELI